MPNSFRVVLVSDSSDEMHNEDEKSEICRKGIHLPDSLGLLQFDAHSLNLKPYISVMK